MDKSTDKPTLAVKSSLARIEGTKARKNNYNYRFKTRSLNFLTNWTRPEAQFMVHQCARFSADPKLPHVQAVKRLLKYLKGTSENGLNMKPYSKKGI